MNYNEIVQSTPSQSLFTFVQNSKHLAQWTPFIVPPKVIIPTPLEFRARVARKLGIKFIANATIANATSTMATIDLSYAIILFNGSSIMQSCAGTWNKDFRDKLRRAYPIVQRVYHWMELNSVNIFPTQWMPSNFIALASLLLSSVASMILEMEWLRQRLVVEFIFPDI